MMKPDWMTSNVSRETMERLEAYVALVEKWNPRINLVSKSSLKDIWARHVWDSAQIVDLDIKARQWLDLGSGGGFPGIVLAIFAKQNYPDQQFHLLESDHRKSMFLRTCARELALNVNVLTNRIEHESPLNADVISARALTDLSALLEFSLRHLKPDGVAIFPKGETWEKELRDAEELWSFEYEVFTSRTNSKAAILKIKELARV